MCTDLVTIPKNTALRDYTVYWSERKTARVNATNQSEAKEIWQENIDNDDYSDYGADSYVVDSIAEGDDEYDYPMSISEKLRELAAEIKNELEIANEIKNELEIANELKDTPAKKRDQLAALNNHILEAEELASALIHQIEVVEELAQIWLPEPK